jgi:hypothetical protein
VFFSQQEEFHFGPFCGDFWREEYRYESRIAFRPPIFATDDFERISICTFRSGVRIAERAFQSCEQIFVEFLEQIKISRRKEKKKTSCA